MQILNIWRPFYINSYRKLAWVGLSNPRSLNSIQTLWPTELSAHEFDLHLEFALCSCSGFTRCSVFRLRCDYCLRDIFLSGSLAQVVTGNQHSHYTLQFNFTSIDPNVRAEIYGSETLSSWFIIKEHSNNSKATHATKNGNILNHHRIGRAKICD